MRFLIPVLLALLIAGPASAIYDFTKPGFHWFMSASCTDVYNDPAPSNGRDLTTLTSWDTIAEAVDFGANLRDPEQTSGSRDGWCDEEPWRIAFNSTNFDGITGSQQFWLGPVILPAEGFYLHTAFSPFQTDWSFLIMFSIFGGQDALGGVLNNTVGTTSVTPFGIATGRDTAGSTTDSGDEFYFTHLPTYFRIDLEGAADPNDVFGGNVGISHFRLED